MDGNDSMNIRNWVYYDQTTAPKSHLGLQLMSPMDEKPLIGGRGGNHYHQSSMMAAAANGGAFHHHRIMEPVNTMDYMRDVWINHREKYLNVLPGNHHHPNNYGGLAETSATHPVQMVPQPSLIKHETVPQMEETDGEKDGGGPLKKRSGGKAQKSPKAKKAKRAPRAPKDECTPSIQRARTPKKSAEVVINGIDLDISGMPIPFCSCTGTSQQCYRWGSGGWQSACCTTAMSVYPLPMSTKRRGARIAGRKMSLGAFKKVLEKLASEGYNFSNPIDLRSHWAKHGTNKFVTIR